MENQTMNLSKFMKYGIPGVISFVIIFMIFPMILQGLTYIMLGLMWLGNKIVTWILHGKKKKYEVIADVDGEDMVVGTIWK